uniref:Uncharacterized protein n=1 Tax=viral metagenome TaxID=1070528 RepID=A0A6M3LST6_9ZZZZ
MPYILPEQRKRLDIGLATLIELIKEEATAGELNYAITKLCIAKMDNTYSYARINNIIGVLECVKQEFYRRLAVPYENEKAEENGDVY